MGYCLLVGWGVEPISYDGMTAILRWTVADVSQAGQAGAR